MTWLIIEPDEILANTLHIDWIERGTGGQSKVVSYWSGPEEHKVTYADDAEAIQAMNDWLAAVGPPTDIVPGDTVRFRSSDNKRISENVDYTVVNVMSGAHPYWTLQGNETGTLFFLNVDSAGFILEKIS